MFSEIFQRQRIISTINEPFRYSLILQNTELTIDIILQLMVITIQMIRRNIHQHSDIGLEIIHAVKLEATQLYYIPVTIFRCNSQRKALPNITGQPHILIGLSQHFVSEGRGGRLAIAAGNTDCFRSIQIAASKLDL